jgi:predicted protein tyrosine phosphatase
MIICDSHCRGVARIKSDYSGGKFEAMGTIKPGAGIENILATMNLNYRHLIKKDVIVVQGGANDVYRNNAQTEKFCKNLSNVNIIIFDIPHQYDLMETSCVNKEIKIFNRKFR